MDNQNMNQQNDQMQNQQHQKNGQNPNPQYQQPYNQPGGYNPYPPYQPRNPQDGKGFSITALVLGLCGIVFCWAAGLNFVLLACDILGIVFGVIGRKKSTMAYGKPSGLATAGFILGIIGTAICALGVLSCVACLSCDACYACGMFDYMF